MTSAMRPPCKQDQFRERQLRLFWALDTTESRLEDEDSCRCRRILQLPTTQTEAASLVRELGTIDAAMIVVGSMIGSGIFITSAESARYVGAPGWLLMAWGSGGSDDHHRLAVCRRDRRHDAEGRRSVRVSFAKLTVRCSASCSAGRCSWWFKRARSRPWPSPSPSFSGYSSPNRGRPLCGRADSARGYAVSLSSQQLVAVALIAFLTLVNTRGLSLGKWIQNTFTFTKTAALIGLIAGRAASWAATIRERGLDVIVVGFDRQRLGSPLTCPGSSA